MKAASSFLIILSSSAALLLAFVITSSQAKSTPPADTTTPSLMVQMAKVSAELAKDQKQYAQLNRDNGPRPPKGPRGGRGKGGQTPDGKRKPSIHDTLKANIYADNSFELYINGRLTAVDSIEFIPHNVISVDILPEYPMTIAVKATDNADPEKGTEYVDNIGDGGFILKIGEHISSSEKWKAKSFFHGPINGNTESPKVIHTPLPEGWTRPGFNDSKWPSAKVFTESEINPKGPYFEHDFKGAKWIWSEDLKLDNTVLFRATFEGPKPDFYTGR